jgi:hypothetical protein
MHRWLYFWALVFLLWYKGVRGRPISATPTISAYESKQQQSHTPWTQNFSTVLQSDGKPSTIPFGPATSNPMPSPTFAEGTSSPTDKESNTTTLMNIDVHLINDSDVDTTGKVFDEMIRPSLFQETLKWTVPLLAFFFALAIGWYARPEEPTTFWTIANLVTAAAVLPFHEQTISDILGNVVKGAAVSFNILHYRATVGSGPRPVIGLVITIVVYFLLYSQRSNVIGDGPEDQGLRVVAPWICAPIAIVTVSELFTLLQWLLAICLAIVGSICGAISAHLHILEQGFVVNPPPRGEAR